MVSVVWLFGAIVVFDSHSFALTPTMTSDWCVALDFEIVLEISLSVLLRMII